MVIKENTSKVIIDLKKYGKKQDAAVVQALNDYGNAVRNQAIKLAPADEGHLRGSIHVTNATTEKKAVDVTVATDYAAYMEFGTRKFAAKYVATLPEDWRAYAQTFKGPGGGSMNEFIQRIMAWVQRKGIGAHKTKSGKISSSAASLESMQNAAYRIALNILQNGVKPRPFLFPAARDNTKKLLSDIRKLFK
jgi:HK97 gp10 family phage protein